jgi:hypothetical protein
MGVPRDDKRLTLRRDTPSSGRSYPAHVESLVNTAVVARARARYCLGQIGCASAVATG